VNTKYIHLQRKASPTSLVCLDGQLRCSNWLIRENGIRGEESLQQTADSERIGIQDSGFGMKK